MHRLFPQMLDAATRFIDTRVECVGTRQKQDLAINPYFGHAVAMLVNSMEVVDEGGASQERPIIAAARPASEPLRRLTFTPARPSTRST